MGWQCKNVPALTSTLLCGGPSHSSVSLCMLAQGSQNLDSCRERKWPCPILHKHRRPAEAALQTSDPLPPPHLHCLCCWGILLQGTLVVICSIYPQMLNLLWWATSDNDIFVSQTFVGDERPQQSLACLISALNSGIILGTQAGLYLGFCSLPPLHHWIAENQAHFSMKPGSPSTALWRACPQIVFLEAPHEHTVKCAHLSPVYRQKLRLAASWEHSWDSIQDSSFLCIVSDNISPRSKSLRSCLQAP